MSTPQHSQSIFSSTCKCWFKNNLQFHSQAGDSSRYIGTAGDIAWINSLSVLQYMALCPCIMEQIYDKVLMKLVKGYTTYKGNVSVAAPSTNTQHETVETEAWHGYFGESTSGVACMLFRTAEGMEHHSDT